MKKFIGDLLKEPIVRFLLIGFFLYLSWLALYEWWIHPMEWVDKAVIDNTLLISQKILTRLGYETALNGSRMIFVKGTRGLFLGDSCNGISLFALYSIFLISFPGKIISKMIFIPLGIIAIHLLNVFRIVCLCIIETHSFEWTEFNHTYTFTIFIYAFIFGVWLLWINKFSSFKKSSVHA
jgi:exosortase/archaeosortase family protein